MSEIEYKISQDYVPAEEFLRDNFSSPTHWPDWNITAAKYFKKEFFYIYAYNGDKVAGICPVFSNESKGLRTYTTGVREFTIPYGGWIFSKETNPNFSRLPLKYNEAFLGLCLPAIPEFNTVYEDSQNTGHLTLISDLKKSNDEIWKTEINSKRRNMIRKAEKSGVTVNHNSDISAFHELYSKANSEYGLPVQDIIFFEDLLSNAKNIKVNLMTAVQENKVIGGLALVHDKNYALYWLGLAVKGMPNLGQGELLQWEAMKTAKEYGCSFYDICYIEKDKLPHIYDFKKGFATHEVAVPYISLKNTSYKVLNKLNRIFS